MPTQPQARIRLADQMERRRLELGLRWQEVAEIGGVSLRAINNARTGTAEIRPLTQQGIARGLRWSSGSVRKILEGGDPEPLPASPAVAPVADRQDLRHLLPPEPDDAAMELFPDPDDFPARWIWRQASKSEEQRLREIRGWREAVRQAASDADAVLLDVTKQSQ
ncbi:MAG TPA: hypothetical protein VKU77_10370 [Streptosporangiaceae bacterium]|nr:hypothetical protein [Streptosporangiaceae bacterium]